MSHDRSKFKYIKKYFRLPQKYQAPKRVWQRFVVKKFRWGRGALVGHPVYNSLWNRLHYYSTSLWRHFPTQRVAGLWDTRALVTPLLSSTTLESILTKFWPLISEPYARSWPRLRAKRTAANHKQPKTNKNLPRPSRQTRQKKRASQ